MLHSLRVLPSKSRQAPIIVQRNGDSNAEAACKATQEKKRDDPIPWFLVLPTAPEADQEYRDCHYDEEGDAKKNLALNHRVPPETPSGHLLPALGLGLSKDFHTRIFPFGYVIL